MKRASLAMVVIAILLSGCASFEVVALDPAGEVRSTHRTARVYVGTGILPIDLIVDAVMLLPGMFNDEPVLLASNSTVIGGMGSPIYIKRVALPGGRILPPNMLPTLKSDVGPWVEFTDETGSHVPIVGQAYVIRTISGFDWPWQ